MYYRMLEFAYYANVEMSDSRVGMVKELGRCSFTISEDTFRLCYLKGRKINPFFAFAEASWILSGSNNLSELQYFIKNYNQFSDDDKTLNGAYGYRIRKYFDIDQLEKAIAHLGTNPNSRRVVISMWSPDDLDFKSNDLPCNTHIYLKIRNGRLDISVLNRSNDLFLGIPYNIFAFHVLQVYIASRLDCKVGIQHHYTDSLHLYERNLSDVKKILECNNELSIKAVASHFKNYDISDYVKLNHFDIAKQNYSAIQSEEIRFMFETYKRYKDKKQTPLVYNKDSILSYVILDWFKDKIEMTKEQMEIISYATQKELYMSDILILQTIKNRDIKEIILHLDDIVNKYRGVEDKFLLTIKSDYKSMLTNLDETKAGQFLLAALVSVIYTSISSNILNPEISSGYLKKIEEICLHYGIALDDVRFMLQFEDKIESFFNN